MLLNQENQKNELIELLEEKAKRQAYEERVIAALRIGYYIVDKTMPCRSYATAGHVYSFLGLKLEEANRTPFQHKIKIILLKNNVIDPRIHGGIVWMKGLVAKDPDKDIETADRILRQHYKDRALYRQRQQENANKRY